MVVLAILLCLPSFESASWGFWAHRRINHLACFTLPPEMFGFYKKHIDLITEQAVNPDKRRYAIEGEAPRHYIDIDHYGEFPFDNVPRKWNMAIATLSEDTLNAYGIVPWWVENMHTRLVYAFKEKNARSIINVSADLGHYIGDAHVPLHTHSNYNGQLTNQHGIHGLLESRIPELFGDNYDYYVGQSEYIEDPLTYIWKEVLNSYLATDSVFEMEKQATLNIGETKKFTFEDRGSQTVKTYSKEFSLEYADLLEGLVLRRMRRAIISIGSFWYSAWVDAGQPNLNNLSLAELTEQEKKALEELDNAYRGGTIKGRTEAP